MQNLVGGMVEVGTLFQNELKGSNEIIMNTLVSFFVRFRVGFRLPFLEFYSIVVLLQPLVLRSKF